MFHKRSLTEALTAICTINLRTHCGLGMAFKKGLKRALELGADIIVSTDADMQYNPKEIGVLIKPILENKADVVIGDRQISTLSLHILFINV